MISRKFLIRIFFIFFIEKGIYCLGVVYNNCSIYYSYKDEYKEIEGYKELSEDEKIIVKTLVNENWFREKENKPVLKIFEKEENDYFTENGFKILIKFEGKDNSKIECLQKLEDKLNLNDKKYALFEIKTEEEKKPVYLYCSDIESINNNGIFEEMKHISISVLACDTANVMNMDYMFYNCSSLTDLNIRSFNTTNVEEMRSMFFCCSILEKLDLSNFNTEKVIDMGHMFHLCMKLKELDLRNFNTTCVEDMGSMFSECRNLIKLNLKSFNTTYVEDMGNMFSNCRGLTELDLRSFNTTNVSDTMYMFYKCRSLQYLKLGNNFNIEKVSISYAMFKGCSNFPQELKKNNQYNVNAIIKYFKKVTQEEYSQKNNSEGK